MNREGLLLKAIFKPEAATRDLEKFRQQRRNHKEKAVVTSVQKLKDGMYNT